MTDAEQQKGRQLQAEADQLYAAAGRKRDELVAQTCWIVQEVLS
ncbi:MAG TPA: hypothetical protein VMV69_03625 [Pirellulales bacterium]|nr:hypothetical protein [Pirellulales bacterium]